MYNIKKYLRIYGGIILPTILLIICIFALTMGVIPAVRTTYGMYIQLGPLSREVKDIKSRLDTIQSLSLTTLNEQMSTLLGAIPQTKSLPTVLTSIESVAKDSGVVLSEININNPGTISSGSADKIDPSNSNIITTNTSVMGPVDKVKEFLDKIISVRRIMRVSGLQISLEKSSVATISGSITAMLSIDSFYALLPKTIGKVSDPIVALSPNEISILNKISQYPLVGVSEIQSSPDVVEREDPFSL